MLCLFLGTASAAFDYQSDKLVVKGYDEECTVSTEEFDYMRMMLAMNGLPVRDLQRADVVWQGKGYAACYVEVEPSVMFIIDETGDAGVVEAGTGI